MRFAGLRLARDPERGRPRREGGRGGHRRGAGRPVEAHPHLLQDGDRQGLPQQGRAPTTCTARRSATRKWPPRARPSAGPTRPSRFPPPSTRPGTSAPAAPGSRATGTPASTPTRRPTRTSRGSSAAAWRATCRPTGSDVAQETIAKAVAKAETIATRKASQNAIEAIAPHLPGFLGGSADLTGSNLTNWSGSKAVTAAGSRQLPELRRARVRHGRHRQRHRAARRLHPLLGHLPRLQRLRAQRAAHGRAHEAEEPLRLHARLHRAGRGRADAPGRRARGEPAPHPEPRPLAPLRHGRDRRGWVAGIERRDGPTAFALSRQNVPFVKPLPGAGRGDPPRRLRALRGAGRPEGRRSSPPAPKSGSRWPPRRRWPRPASRCASCRCPARASSTGRTPRGAPPCCPRGCRACPSRRASPTTGASTWASTGAAIGVDSFGESAPAGDVYKHFGVDAEHVVAAVKSVL